LIIWFRGL